MRGTRGWLGAALGVAAVLLLALAVSVSDAVWFVRGGDGNSADELPPGLRPGADDRPDDRVTQASDNHLGQWFSVLTTIVLFVIAVVLIIALARVVRVRRRRRRERARTADVGSMFDTVTTTSVALPDELVAAADRLDEVLTQGSPRNAIVTCWVALESACASVGLPRNPAETSVEFTTRVLGAFALARDPIDGLAGLYREARFSEHDITEHHRDAAIGLLGEVQAQLRAAQGERSGSRP